LNCKSCDLSIALGLKEPYIGETLDASQARISKYLSIGIEDISRYVIYPTDSFPLDRELGHFVINHSFHPLVKGHIVIQPINCPCSSGQIHDFDEKAVTSLFKTVGKVSKSIEEIFRPERVYFWSFNEQQPNSPNWHLHVHIAPRNLLSRYRGPEWLFQIDKHPEEVKSDEIEKTVSDIREKLQANTSREKTDSLDKRTIM